jgi:hypothetical protein
MPKDAADALVQGPAAVALEQAGQQPLPGLLRTRQRPAVAGLEPEHEHGPDPIVVPVQAISVGGSTTCRVEMRVLGPAFQRNTVPGWTGPSTLTDLTSGFQDGH